MTNDLSYCATIKLIGVSPVPTSIFSSTKSTSAQVSTDIRGKTLIYRGDEMKEEDLVLDNNDYLNRNDFGEHLIFIC